MPNEEKTLAFATILKVLNGEPLTLQDLDRWGAIITHPVNVANPKIEEVEQLKFNIRNALKQVYFAEQK